MADLFSCFDDEGNDHEQAVEDDKTSRESAKPSVSQTGQKSSKREHENDEELTKRMKLESIEDVMEELNLGDLDNRITIHTIETLEACMHEVAVPPNCEYQTLKRSNDAPVRTYSFILDPFQKEAILCIDNNQSVLVSAHTSAGKTVVAEYAVAQSLKNKQRVIYTTPIKALSNQKYREFLEEFSDVGLITGDVTINPSASCLIMTTEILRNMLYRGSELLREVGWVVFDEIHYMRDKERGVVWEETLILLPDSVRNVFLSATIPNARQFAEWVCHIHKQPCHVVYTDYRPTPLQHYIFPDGGDGIHLVVDVQGQFKENNFNTAMNVLQGDSAEGELGGTKIAKKSSAKRNAAQSNVFNVVKMIIERNFSPVIAFSFSKKDCELYAMQMSKLDFNTAEEKKLVDEVFNNAMDVLSDDDKHLPQVDNVLPHLRRGIGIHHGGLLPILKETIEILFSEGLIKVLFATETFAMGLNMPARTVLFTGMRKFDGKDYRWLTSGEYIQMSGRAGRRGLDDKGIVILMVDEKVSPATGREIIQGKPDPINSSFHLTYNMVLNLLRVEEINPEYMMERSFFQFQNHSSIPDLYDKYKTKWDEYQSLKIQNESSVKSYHQIKLTFQQLQEKSLTYILEPMKLLPFLQPGRLIKVKYNEYDYDWGAIINFKKTTQKPRGPKIDQKKNIDIETKLVISIMLHVSEEFTNEFDSIPLPCPPGQEGKLEVVPCNSSLITEISSVRVRLPDDVRPLDNRKSVKRAIDQAKVHFKGKLPILEAEKDMGITDKEFKRIKKQMDVLKERIKSHPLHSDSKRDEIYSKYERKLKCKNELDAAKKELKKAKSLLQMDELKNRKRVLRRLGFCDEQDVISTKGRIACEISGADELLLTEMIFCGMLDNLTSAQCVALLSCFVFDEKSTGMPKLAEELSGPLRKMQDIARRIAKVSIDCKLELDESKYVESFKPFLMDIVFAWCNGALFLELCQMTDIFEGSIIRCMRRLEELLRQLLQVSKTIGNKILEEKVTEGIKLIKRDIVFAASLYL